MKKKDLVIGATYRAIVSGKNVPVRLDGPRALGGWWATNKITGRCVIIRTAARLRPTKGLLILNAVESGLRALCSD